VKTAALWKATIGLVVLLAAYGTAQAAPPISGLKASFRDGQVFLTWNEAQTPDGTTFNVYVSDSPIAEVSQAKRIGHHVERHSARDWWEEPASFTKGEKARQPVGFLIQSGGQRLDPAGGLFVHTVTKGEPGRLFFAVTYTDPGGKEDAALRAGANSLREGIAAAPADPKPIWQLGGRQPEPGAGKGKALSLVLHSKSEVNTHNEYLAFGDQSMGWREGLPFKFRATVRGEEVVIRPTDRAWIGRPFEEARDGGACTYWTFWYGYNSKIYDRKLKAEGVPTNYTERRNLWILDWVRNYFQPDPNRWYCSGSSMGGCGTISFAWRHPELFAALWAEVPIVSFTYLPGSGSAWRLEPACWTGPITAELRDSEGVPLLDRMNGEKFVRESNDDLPPLFLINGRKDGSIPWGNNPSFYRALNAAQQGFAVYWDDGTHPTAGKDAPEDVKAWAQDFRKRLARNRSFPAFSNTSTNRNPGNGRPEDGDIIGWMNRGMDWKDTEDEPDHYSIIVLAGYPGIAYPVRTDVTLRRMQNFKIKALERVSVRIGDGQPASIAADANGRITIPGVTISSKAGVRISIRRAGGPAQAAR
jgi:hypothetical protein